MTSQPVERPSITKGENLLARVNELHRQVNELTWTVFSEDDINGYLAKLGIAVERFLADAVFPDLHRTYKGGFFHGAVERLHPVIIDPSTPPLLERHHVDALHALRGAYNRLKHQPDKHVSLSALITLMQDSTEALRALVATNHGSIGARAFGVTCTFWIGATDYYHQGVTEVFVYLPKEATAGWMPPRLLTYFIACKDWDRLLAGLAANGKVVSVTSALSEEIAESMCHGEDPLEPRVYVGPLKTLLTLLDEFRVEMVQNRKINMHNFQHRVAPYTTMLLALELLREDPARVTITVADVLARVNSLSATFGLSDPATVQEITDQAREFVALVGQLPPTAWKALSGPTWLDSESFTSLASFRDVLSSDGAMAVSPDLKIILKAVE